MCGKVCTGTRESKVKDEAGVLQEATRGYKRLSVGPEGVDTKLDYMKQLGCA